MSIFHSVNPLERDWARSIYEYTLDDGEILYIADFGTRPLKSALHDPIQFTVQKEKLVVMDTDQIKRAGSIRARVLKKGSMVRLN
jgi:hypothetical protein